MKKFVAKIKKFFAKMKKHCTVDTVDGISYTADLESKSEDEAQTNFDHDLISENKAYTDHDLISKDESFDNSKSSIKILNQDQNQIIIK
jgi:hypothetical protein